MNLQDFYQSRGNTPNVDPTRPVQSGNVDWSQLNKVAASVTGSTPKQDTSPTLPAPQRSTMDYINPGVPRNGSELAQFYLDRGTSQAPTQEQFNKAAQTAPNVDWSQQQKIAESVNQGKQAAPVRKISPSAMTGIDQLYNGGITDVNKIVDRFTAAGRSITPEEVQNYLNQKNQAQSTNESMSQAGPLYSTNDIQGGYPNYPDQNFDQNTSLPEYSYQDQEIQENQTEPATGQTQYNDFHSNLSIPTEQIGNEELANQTSGDSLLADIQATANLQISMEQTSYNDLVNNLKSQAALTKASYDAAIAQASADKATADNMNKQQEEITLEANRLAAEEAKARADQQLAIMNDNNSRLEGYLKGKLTAAGMLDGSGGLTLLTKYMQSSQLALNEAERNADNTQKYYANQSRQIMLDYTKNALQIGQTYNSQVKGLLDGQAKAISDINKDLLTSESTKNKNILSIVKDLQSTKLEYMKYKDQKVMDLFNMKMEQAKFEHEISMDVVKQDQWEKEFGFDQYKFQADFGLNVAKFDEDSRRFGLNYAMDQQRFVFDQAKEARDYDLRTKQFAAENYFKQAGLDLDYDRLNSENYFKGENLNLAKDQFGLEQSKFGLEQSKFDQDTQKQMFDQTSKLVDAGVLPKSALNSYLRPEDVITSGVYVSGKKTLDLGGTLKNVVSKVQDWVKNGKVSDAYQCVQFVRDVVKDLPTGLYTLQDKIDKLVKSKNSIEAPEPGAAVIMNTGQPAGHIALVTSKDDQARKFTVAEFNYKKGQYTTRTISYDDPKIEGYWKSPNIQTSGRNDPSVKKYYDQLALTTTKMSPKTKQLKEQELQNFIDSGDTQGAQQYVDKVAYDSMQPNEQKLYNSSDTLASSIDRIVNNIDANVGGVYNKLLSTNAKWGDLAQDPRFRDMQAQIQSLQAGYINDLYGANLTGGELERANSFLISPDDKGVDAIAKLRQLSAYSKEVKNMVFKRATGQQFNISNSGSIQVRDKKSGQVYTYDGDSSDIPTDEYEIVQ